MVSRAQTDDIYGAAVDRRTGEKLEDNVQGEAQQKLDVICNEVRAELRCACVCSECVRADDVSTTRF
jgi:fructose-1,6-bisphosphatase I